MVFQKHSINKKRPQSESSFSPNTNETSFVQDTSIKCTSPKEIRPGSSLEVDIRISFEKRYAKTDNSDIPKESLVESLEEIIQWSKDADYDIGIITTKTYVTISPLIHQQSFQNSDKYEIQQSSDNIISKTTDLDEIHSTQEDTKEVSVSKQDSENQISSLENLEKVEQQEQRELEQKTDISIKNEDVIMSSEELKRYDLKEDIAVTSINMEHSSGSKPPHVSQASELTEVINVETKVDNNDLAAVDLQTDDKNDVCEDPNLKSDTHEGYDDGNDYQQQQQQQQQQQEQEQQEQSAQILSTSESTENLEHESVVNNEVQATYTPQSVNSDLKDGTNVIDEEAINDYSSIKEKSQLSNQEISVSHQKLDEKNAIHDDAVTVTPNEIKDTSTELTSEFTSNKDIQDSSPSHVEKLSVLNTSEVNESVKPAQLIEEIQLKDQESEYELKSDSDLQASSIDKTPFVLPCIESGTEAFNQIVEAQEELVAVCSRTIVIPESCVISLTLIDRKPAEMDMNITATNKELTNLADNLIQSVVLDNYEINSETPIKPIIRTETCVQISMKTPDSQPQTMTTLEACRPTEEYNHIPEDKNIPSSHVAQFDATEDESLKLKEQSSTHEDVSQQQCKDNEDDIHIKEDILMEKLSLGEPTIIPVKEIMLETEISEPHERIVYESDMSEKDEGDRELGEETNKTNTQTEEITSKREYSIINEDKSSHHDQPHLIIEQKQPSLTSISLDLPKKAMLPTIISTDSFAVPDITQVPETLSEQRIDQNIEIESIHSVGSEKSSNIRYNLTTDKIPENQEVSCLPVGSELEISKFTPLSVHEEQLKAAEPIDEETIVSKNELQSLVEQNVVSLSKELNKSETSMVAEQTDTSKQLESIKSEDKTKDTEIQKTDQLVLKDEEYYTSEIPTNNRSGCSQLLALIISTTFQNNVDSTDISSEGFSKEIKSFTVQSSVGTSENTNRLQNILNFQYTEPRQSVDMSKAEEAGNDKKCNDDGGGGGVSVYKEHELSNKEVNSELSSLHFTPVNIPIQQIETVDSIKNTDDSFENELQKSTVRSETDVLENTAPLEVSVSKEQTDKKNSMDYVCSSDNTMSSEQKLLTPVSLKDEKQELPYSPTNIIPTETQPKPLRTSSGEFQVVTVPNVDSHSVNVESKSSFASQNSQASLSKYSTNTPYKEEQVVSKEQADTLALLKVTKSTESSELNASSSTVKENISNTEVKNQHLMPSNTSAEEMQSVDSMKTASISPQRELNESVDQEESLMRSECSQVDDNSLVIKLTNVDRHQDSHLPIFSDSERIPTVSADDKITEKTKVSDISLRVNKDEEKNKPQENISQHGTASILSAEMIKSSLMTTASLNSVKWNVVTGSQITADNNQLITELSFQLSDGNKLADSVQGDESTKPELTINAAQSFSDIINDDKSEAHQSLSVNVSPKQDSQSLSKNLQSDSAAKIHMNKKDPSTFTHQKILGNSSLVFHMDQYVTKASPSEANEGPTSSGSRNLAGYSPDWTKNSPDVDKHSSTFASQIQSIFPDRYEGGNLKACCYCCQLSGIHFVCRCYCSQHHNSPAFPNYCQTNMRAHSISRSNFLHCNSQMTPCTYDCTTPSEDNQRISTFDEPDTCSLKLQPIKSNGQGCQTSTYENPTDSNLRMQCISRSSPTICRCLSPRTVCCCCSHISYSTISVHCNSNPHHKDIRPYLSASISQRVPSHHCCCNISISKKHGCASHVHCHLKSPPNNSYWS